MPDSTPPAFAQMGLPAPLLKTLKDLGYEIPTAIQAQAIPLLLDGRDLLGQAQTGTGKTAAFALPLLARLDLKSSATQVLVLTPTRELAIQVAEAFKSYAAKMTRFRVLPVYGGQEYGGQIRALQRGVQVIVGTPGRVMDHMRRGNIRLDNLQALVLDEADEMLRMGFIDDVEWVLEQTPERRQVALFSATVPGEIRRISKNYLRTAAEVTIEVKTTTADTIRQRYWPVTGTHKLDALTRILEAETTDAVLVFVRTKTASQEIAEKLEARGYRAQALNGDIAQNSRERIVNQLKSDKLDILVATDVAARGLDVERISHVINYDIPHDTEAYVHRIGRTGRAGREGDAILFVAPRERRMLQAIEKATRQPIELMQLPSTDAVNNRRIERFKQRIGTTLANEDLELFRELVAQYRQEHEVDALDIAAALARLAQGNAPFLLSGKSAARPALPFKQDPGNSDTRRPRGKGSRATDDATAPGRERNKRELPPPEAGMERFRIEVGHQHQVKPGNIVGAIANEAGIDSKYIGRIEIFDEFSLVDMPENMPAELMRALRPVRIAGQRMNISLLDGRRRKGGSGKPKTARVKRRQRQQKDKGKPKRAR